MNLIYDFKETIVGVVNIPTSAKYSNSPVFGASKI